MHSLFVTAMSQSPSLLGTLATAYNPETGLLALSVIHFLLFIFGKSDFVMAQPGKHAFFKDRFQSFVHGKGTVRDARGTGQVLAIIMDIEK